MKTLNFFEKSSSNFNEQDFISNKILEPDNLSLILKNSLGSNISFMFIIFFFIKIFNFSFGAIRIFFLLRLISKCEFGIGLVGLSLPLIFNNQATFSGAETNI